MDKIYVIFDTYNPHTHRTFVGAYSTPELAEKAKEVMEAETAAVGLYSDLNIREVQLDTVGLHEIKG